MNTTPKNPTTMNKAAIAAGQAKEPWGSKILRLVLTERVIALALLTVIMVVVFNTLGRTGHLYAPFNLAYMSASLQAFVPLALLALAEMFVITSGRGGIDLSVGAMVSVCGLIFGALVQIAGLPVLVAGIAAVIVGGLLGLLNGVLVGIFRFPPLIATLATSYVYASLAMVASGQAPVSGPEVAATNSLTRSIPLFGNVALPIQVIIFLLPVVVLAWFLLEKTGWGRSLLGIGTNDTAAQYAGQRVKQVRVSAYVMSGLLCGVAAIVNVAQFASARPDAGTSGNGMTLPAITIAALGGVLISGGLARVSGVVIAALLITWLNAALLISFQGSMGPRMQLLALGLVLIASVLLNSYAARRYQMRL